MVTPIRNLRVPDDEWSAWKQAAKDEGLTLTAWVRKRCSTEPPAGGWVHASGRIDVEDWA